METEQPNGLSVVSENLLPVDHLDGLPATFQPIIDEWNKAEFAIKRSEQIALDVSIPAISELRYAGRRLIDALQAARMGRPFADVAALIEDVRFCCYRAQHDAVDAAMSKIAIDLDDLTSRLGFDAVRSAYPEINDFYRDFTLARNAIALSRAKRDNRGAIYDTIAKVNLPDLASRYEALMAVRPIAKWTAARLKLQVVIAITALLATVLAALFTGLTVDWSQYLDAPSAEAKDGRGEAAGTSPSKSQN
jgi:hypothetical protein